MIVGGTGDTCGHESPRSHSHIGGQRLSIRPADWQPSTFHRHGPWTNSARHDCRKGERRHHEADARVDQATIRSGWARISTSLGTDGCWRRRLQDKPTKSTVVATKALPRHQYGHPGAHMPRRSAGQEASLLVRWHLPNALQVEFNARSQRRLRLLERCAVGGDIEIRTDRMPLATTLSSVTSQCEVHEQLPRFPCEDIVRRDQRTIGSFRLPEPLCVAWGFPWRTA